MAGGGEGFDGVLLGGVVCAVAGEGGVGALGCVEEGVGGEVGVLGPVPVAGLS